MLGKEGDPPPRPRKEEARLSHLPTLPAHPDCLRPPHTALSCSYLHSAFSSCPTEAQPKACPVSAAKGACLGHSPPAPAVLQREPLKSLWATLASASWNPLHLHLWGPLCLDNQRKRDRRKKGASDSGIGNAQPPTTLGPGRVPGAKLTTYIRGSDMPSLPQDAHTYTSSAAPAPAPYPSLHRDGQHGTWGLAGSSDLRHFS